MKIEELLKEKSGIKLDIGAGDAKTREDFVGIDYRPLKGIDIVHNLEITPWPLPDECVTTAVASHVLEHITPHAGDARLQPLIELLVQKKIITEKEAMERMGEPGPTFMRFMDEVWRILKPGAQFAFVVPYAESHGMFQDPTHINFINETTMCYFDPLDETGLYRFYKPKPWKIQGHSVSKQGAYECVLQKRKWDTSYGQSWSPTAITAEDVSKKAIPRIF